MKDVKGAVFDRGEVEGASDMPSKVSSMPAVGRICHAVGDMYSGLGNEFSWSFARP